VENKRLTEKVKNTDDYIRLATKDKQAFINKLGRLEDLEEEIGCPLEVVREALKYGIYFKDLIKDYKLIYIPAVTLTSINTEWYLSNQINICLNVKDYKVLWWLKADKSE
jgi:hypothetical protein